MVESSRPLRILVYSDNPRVREQVKLAFGKRVHPDLPELTYVEIATGPMVIRQMDKGGFDLVILDGEAAPVGGMGIAKQLKDEIADCPPILVLTGRADATFPTACRLCIELADAFAEDEDPITQIDLEELGLLTPGGGDEE